MPKGQVVSVGNADGFLELDQGRRLPMHVRWLSEIDPSKINWPSKKIFSVKLKEGAGRDFGAALTTARSAKITSKEDQVAVALPDSATWQQTDSCLETVGSALLTSAPPPYGDGTRLNRSLPIPRGAGAWFDSNAYPPKALATKTAGDVGIKVRVDRYGYPLECNVVEGSGSNILDDATCVQIMKIAHFYPALNDAGIASEGKWETVIRWRLP
ncbi:MAG: TonB family protein [Sphingomonadaceae bacterium]|nr:TonB family protein [Sphingomonadaceae bacterium]